MCAKDEADHCREQLDRHGYYRSICEHLSAPIRYQSSHIPEQACAYEAIAKPAWWNKAIDMGPVIEQGTHFCDLSRYFGGDVDIGSVVAHSVEWDETPGQLSKIPIDESQIPEDQRIPRMTTATWKYTNGAVGTFVHAVALQGTAYSCELEVYCDGFQMR